MGGSTISLTPVVGDALLDPHLLARLGILKAHPAIGQISVTTNGIALDRYSDKEVRYLLDAFYSIQVSIGGLDPESYQAMYGVDQFARVEQALERLVELRSSGSKGAHLTFAFRTADWKSLDPFKKQLQRYRRQGVFVSHMWTYANYGGQVASSGKVGLTILENPANKRKCCIYPRIHSAVCWDGTVTACSCTDLECAQLKIGKVGVSPLSEILAGKRRAGILNSFEKGTLADICTKCSAYRSDASGALSFFSDVHTNKPLPLDFFHEMMT
jgi:MoaA/NifB/PqqE/SkfB family radical SAM enzyme